jgi:hypothetical protein
MPTLLHPDDPAFHRMVAAFEGRPEPSLALNRALRDAMVSYAAERCPYYRSAIRAGMAFEEIPILTKDVLKERYDDLIADGVHRDRWAVDQTSGSLGPAVKFVRDTAQGYLENVSAFSFLNWMQGTPPDATRVLDRLHAPDTEAPGPAPTGARSGDVPRPRHGADPRPAPI